MSLKKSTLIFILLITINNLFAGGNNEKIIQNSDSLKINNSNVEFKVIRESKNGTDLITMHLSNPGNSYYVSNTIPQQSNLSDDIQYLKDTNLNIKGLYDFEYKGDYNKFKKNSNVLIYNYTGNSTTDLITLISHDELKKSYQFQIEIKPTLNTSSFNIENENFVEELQENPNLRRYLKKQLLGLSTYNQNSFPLGNIDNGYIVEVKPVFNDKSIDVLRENKFERLSFFDLIYEYGINYNHEYGRSIIQKLLNVYFEKNKPLFHHYMNKSSEELFDYTVYQKLSKDEGLEFVTKAFTYLTWGLEYSLHGNNGGDTPFNFTDNVYPSQILNDNRNLTNWINGTINDKEELYRSNNYLPYFPSRTEDIINEDDITYMKSTVSDLQLIKSNLTDYLLTTPFSYLDSTNKLETVVGSSIPFVRGGLDSPRTFNYKMYQQYEIIKNKTGGYYNYNGLTNNYLFSLNDGKRDVYSEDFYYFKGANPNEINPFYPGWDFNNEDGYVGSNLTGVDIFGLISGALSMTSFSSDFVTINNKRDTLDKLNSYFKMSAPNYNAGTNNLLLNDKGLPFFSESPFEDIGAITFRREDIERITVIVPDLSLIQPGDILVGRTEGVDEIAIVVDLGSNQNSSTFDMSEVLLLSVTEKDRRVSLNYWGEGSDKLSTFVSNPKDFIPRRFIKYNSDLESTYEESNETWDPMIYTPKSITAVLDINANNPENYGNWIPNTGEFFNIKSIMFKNSENQTILDENGIDIILESPVDLNYDTSGDEDSTKKGSNILVNKGDGFEFYAHFKTYGNEIENQYLKLGTFNINDLSNSGENRYTINYNSDVFDEIGNTKNGFEFKYYYKHGAEFKIIDGNSVRQTREFAIRPINSNIRPGDDIALRFSFSVDNITSIATSDFNSHLAVYDKKLLWRANLYIDNSDMNDWNVRYPWNAPITGDINGKFTDSNRVTTRIVKLNNKKFDTDSNEAIWFGNNQWNMKFSGETRLNNENFEPDLDSYQLEHGDGRQTVKYQDFTYHSYIADGTGKDVVSYAYGCADSPFEYLDELYQQKNVMSLYYNRIGTKFKKPKHLWYGIIDKLNIESFTPEQYNLYVEDYDLSKGDLFKEDGNHIILEGWNKTTSPNSSRNNFYIKPSVYLGTDNVEYRVPPEVLNLSGSENFPFIPGYSLWYYFNNGSCPDWLNVISAGVDCNGLVSRSASYNGNLYLWDDSSNHNLKEYDPGTNKKWFTSPSYPYWKSVAGNKIVSDRIAFKSTIGKSKNLDKVKPGDIMYLQKDNGRGWHITLVLDIKYSENIELTDLKLLESTWNEPEYKWAKVIDSRTLNFYKNANWVIVRLKQEE